MSDAPSSAGRKQPSKPSPWATFATINASFDAACDSKTLVHSLMIFSLSQVPQLSYLQQEDHICKLHFAQQGE